MKLSGLNNKSNSLKSLGLTSEYVTGLVYVLQGMPEGRRGSLLEASVTYGRYRMSCCIDYLQSFVQATIV
jgi:hypothetical protein